MEEHGGHSYKSFVRGVPVNFSPEKIRSMMRFKAQVEGARTDFETRKEHDQQLDSVLADLCMPGATWKLSIGQQRVPIQLRRQELNPIARGWHELSIHSLIPSSNRLFSFLASNWPFHFYGKIDWWRLRISKYNPFEYEEYHPISRMPTGCAVPRGDVAT
ncbi:hypothetical protein PIB30_060036 [Stylosanthes scabra]|uniref:Putative plant transposon protein domain-containing protein n=1 Tax=Stylosanthes scabra TaxID=79078 RepID=A0ABU6TMJ4_9FABA|nr:hypothetical protein [Stylosanthes scabra]